MCYLVMLGMNFDTRCNLHLTIYFQQTKMDQNERKVRKRLSAFLLSNLLSTALTIEVSRTLIPRLIQGPDSNYRFELFLPRREASCPFKFVISCSPSSPFERQKI